MRKKQKQLVGALILIGLFVGVLWYAGILYDIFRPPPPPPPEGWEGGVFDMKCRGFDRFNPATTYPSANWTVNWYVQRSGVWTSLGAGNVTVELTEQDAGYIYAMCEIPGAVHGTTHNNFIDWQKTVDMNSRVAGVADVSYGDFDNDGVDEYMFKYNMMDIPKPASGNPQTTFYLYLIQEGYIAYGACSDISSIGTTKVTKYIQWYVTFTGEQTGLMIRSVKLYFNSTDTTKLYFKRLNIPGIGYLGESSFTYDKLGSATTTDGQNWEYICGKTLYTAHPLLYSKNVLNRFDFTWEIELDLATNDDLNLRIEITYIDVAGTLRTLTDDVNIVA